MDRARRRAARCRRGTLTLIWRADGLADVLAALGGLRRHRDPADLSETAAAAIRILVRAVKGSGAPLVLLPPLMLNDADGTPSAEAEAILRGGASLPMTA